MFEYYLLHVKSTFYFLQLSLRVTHTKTTAKHEALFTFLGTANRWTEMETIIPLSVFLAIETPSVQELEHECNRRYLGTEHTEM
jgi:hypothetical protein